MSKLEQKKAATMALSAYNAVSRARMDLEADKVVAVLRAAWTPGPELLPVHETVTIESVERAFGWLQSRGLAKVQNGKLGIFRTPTGYGYPLVMCRDRTELMPLTGEPK